MRKVLLDSQVLVTHVRGSGPGGQNRNKRFSGVRVEHLPTGIVVMATERRSQSQNLAAAMERLRKRLDAYFKPKTPRIETKPSRSSRRKLAEEKKKQSQKKSLRKKIWD